MLCYATSVAGPDDVAFSTPALRLDRCVVHIGVPCVSWVVVLVRHSQPLRWKVTLGPHLDLVPMLGVGHPMSYCRSIRRNGLSEGGASHVVAS